MRFFAARAPGIGFELPHGVHHGNKINPSHLKQASRRGSQELFYGNPARANQQLPGRLKRLIKGRHAGQGISSAATFHFDNDQIIPAVQDEVHLFGCLSPVEDLAFSSQSKPAEIGAHGRFHHSPPLLRGLADLSKGAC